MSRARGVRGLAGFVLAAAVVVGLGYLVFLLFITAFSPQAGALSLLAFSVVAGVAAVFNPCAFPLLPVYLAELVQLRAGEAEGRLGSLVYGGAVAALGLVAFNLLLGGLVAAAGAVTLGSLALASPNPSPAVRLLRGSVGILLLALGGSHLLGRGLTFGFLEGLGQRFRFLGGDRPTRNLFVYGFGYNAVGVGCGGPILAGLAVFAFAYGGPLATLGAFLLYSLTMALILLVISVLPGTVSEESLRRMGRATGWVQRVAGGIQAAVGSFLVLTAIYTALFVAALFPG